jgi:hypothetical protein
VRDAKGLILSVLAKDDEFSHLSRKVNVALRAAVTALDDLGLDFGSRFDARFKRFSESMTPADFGAALCEHHEEIQKGKSREGKRPWFDRLGQDRIYLRQNYTLRERPDLADVYVHDYRAKPIQRFYRDLK